MSCEIAVLARRLVDAPQRAADQRDLAVMGGGGMRRSFRRGATLEAKQATATRPLVAADQLVEAVAHLGLGAGVAVHAARWSNRRPWPARPRRRAARSAASSVASPTSGSGSSFQSPVCSTVPAGVRITTALGSGIEWVSVISSSSNGAEREAAGHRHLCDRRPRRASLASRSLRAQQRGGEGRRVDRAAQPRPEIGHGADMVLVARGSARGRGGRSRRSTMKAGSGMMTSTPGVRLVAEGDAADRPSATCRHSRRG